MKKLIDDRGLIRSAILKTVRGAKLIPVGDLWEQLASYHNGTCRSVLWNLLANNVLHADYQWRIRPKRKTDWMVED